jgi:hypothetical protein
MLTYMYGLRTFYHQGYELMQSLGPYMKELTVSLQNARDTLEEKSGLKSRLLMEVFAPTALPHRENVVPPHHY